MENFCVARLQSWRSGSRISLMVQARILLASILWEWSSLLRDDISDLLARYYIAYANARMEVMDGRQNDWKRNNNCSSLIQYIFFSAPVCHTIHRMRCVRKTFETDCFVGRKNLSRPSCLRVDIQRLNRNQLNCCLYRVQLGCVALRHNRCKWSGCYRSSGIRTNKMIFLNFIIMISTRINDTRFCFLVLLWSWLSNCVCSIERFRELCAWLSRHQVLLYNKNKCSLWNMS